MAENITSELFCVLTRFRSGNAELLVKCLGRNFPPNATYICYKVLADYVLKIRLIYMVQGVEVCFSQFVYCLRPSLLLYPCIVLEARLCVTVQGIPYEPTVIVRPLALCVGKTTY